MYKDFLWAVLRYERFMNALHIIDIEIMLKN